MTAAKPADAVGLVQRLIRSACVNDGTPGSGQERRNVDVLVDYLGGLDALRHAGVEVEILEPAPGRANLIARLRGTEPSAPSLAFVGHLDVVPADASTWKHDPFGGDIVDGQVWGRGAVDMLTLTAAMTVAFRILIESDVRLAGDVVLAATADEESGSRWGMGWLVENRPELVLADGAITESGGGILLPAGDRPHVTVTTGQKGGAIRAVVAHGTSGHGSMPYGVRSGALLAAEAVSRISSHRPIPQLPPRWRELLEALGLAADLVDRLTDPATLDDALDETGEYARMLHALTHMTLSPTIIASGMKVNMLPDTGRVDVDIRLLEGQTGDDADRELRAALDGLPGVFDIEGTGWAPAVSAPSDGDLYRAIAAAAAEAHGGAQALPLSTPGGNDARHYLSRGIPCYGFGLFSSAIDLAEFRRRFHGADERIDIPSIELCASGYVRVAQLLGTV